MKKFNTSKNSIIILVFASCLVLGAIAFSVFSILNFSADKVLAAITLGFVGLAILLPLLKNANIVFCKVEFSDKGIAKYYHKKLITFIKWDEILKMSVIGKNGFFTETKIYIQKQEFKSSEYIKDLRENIYISVYFKVYNELIKYKKYFPKNIENRKLINI